jgi:polysaccharide export outer membrane protein
MLIVSSVQCSVTLAQPLLEPSTEPTVNIESSPEGEAASPAYILGPGDQINISVYGYEEFTDDKVVLSDGTIQLPLVGMVTVLGRTIDQLEQELAIQLTYFLVNPVVTVTLIQPRPVEVTVSGEVLRPGPVRSDAFQGNPTLSEALLAAGGITPNADIRQVELRRYSPIQGSTPIVINLWDAISSENVPPDFILQDGDSIYIPRLSDGETLDRRLTARSSFAPETVRVRVVGEVNDPGEVTLPPNSSLSSAVAIAGGPTDDARLSRVAFIRLNEEGQVERQVVDLRNLTDNYQVQEGDVILIPKQDGSSLLDIATRVLGPFGALLNVFTGLDRLIQ